MHLIIDWVGLSETLKVDMFMSDSVHAWQILGFDILLKSDGMPVLLEVNASPSMRLDYEQQSIQGVVEVVKSPVDEEIKKALVLDTLLLVAPRIRTLSSQASTSSLVASSRYGQPSVYLVVQ